MWMTVPAVTSLAALLYYVWQHRQDVEPESERGNKASPADCVLSDSDLLYLCLQELDGAAELAKVRAVSKAWRLQAARVASTSVYWLRGMSFEALLRSGAPEPVLLRALHSDSDHAFEFIELYANGDNTPRQIDPELDDVLDRAPALMRWSAPWWTTRAKAEDTVKTLAKLGRGDDRYRRDEMSPSCPSSRLPSIVAIVANLHSDAGWCFGRPTRWTWFGWIATPYRNMCEILKENRLAQAIGFVVSVRVRCVPHALNFALSDFDGQTFDASTEYTAGTMAVLWTRDHRQLVALHVQTLSEAVLLRLRYDDARDLRGHLGDEWVAAGPDAPIVEVCTSPPSPSSEPGTLGAYCKIMVKHASDVSTFHAGVLGDPQHRHRVRYANGGEKWRRAVADVFLGPSMA